MKAAVFFLAVALAGCTHVKVQELGAGRHALAAVSPSAGFSGSHEAAIEAANDYCGRSRQRALIESFEDQPGVGPLGEHTSRIVFTCAAPTVLHF
jgi:hypothetical protein